MCILLFYLFLKKRPCIDLFASHHHFETIEFSNKHRVGVANDSMELALYILAGTGLQQAVLFAPFHFSAPFLILYGAFSDILITEFPILVSDFANQHNNFGRCFRDYIINH